MRKVNLIAIAAPVIATTNTFAIDGRATTIEKESRKQAKDRYQKLSKDD